MRRGDDLGMQPGLSHFAHALWITFVAVSLLAALATLLPRMNRRIADAWCRAPLLDLMVASFTWAPWVVAGVLGRWAGVAGAIVGEAAALIVWTAWHELLYREAVKGPRIVKFINRTVGTWQNHLALWVTMIALPGFWLIRFHEMFVYWPLVVLLGFPKYRQADWINFSRQKFEGLVGHDLIWCLYCDWMTGVYCLGAEMLRNVESFWCPIKFYEGKKCANCAIDFPDINQGWIEPGKSMADVVAKMEEMYTTEPRAHFMHPVRLTVRGKEISTDGNGDPLSSREVHLEGSRTPLDTEIPRGTSG